MGRYQAECGGSGVHPLFVLPREALGGKAVANTARPMARIGYKSISGYDGNLSERVNGTAGASFNQLQTGAGVMQMDKLDNSQLVMIQKQANGKVREVL